MITELDLRQFTGTENWYKHWTGKLLYTDGIKYVAENAANGNGAYWLIDVVASYQHEPKVKAEPFQLWTIKAKNGAAVVTMQSDTDEPNIVKQEIKHTDFDMEELVMYVENGVLYLPSER